MYICNRCMDGWMDGWTDGWMDGPTDGWTDGAMDRFVRYHILFTTCTYIAGKYVV